MGTIIGLSAFFVSPYAITLNDLKRFPPSWYLHQQYEFAERHLKWLDIKIENALNEEELAYYQCWHHYVTRRKMIYWKLASPTNVYVMREVREEIGWDAYYAGWLPDIYPLWEFEQR